MELEALDKECSALGGLFQQVINDMKIGVPYYEDLVSKAAKLHSQLKNTILCLGSFLDTFQKIADAATNTKGATREIGACLTRIVIRHKAMEARMKTLCSALLDCMVLPLQDKMDEWKKSISALDKEHAKEYKKLRAEIKKKSENSNRLQKKNKKNKTNEHQRATDHALGEVLKYMKLLEETEKTAVRKVLTEERSRYCTFVACLKPVLDEEISLMTELQQLEEVKNKLNKHTDDPFKLPPASEQVIDDVKSADGKFTFQTPPSSPSSLGSRKSSMCSISSAGSSGAGSNHQSPSHQPNVNLRHRSLSQQHHTVAPSGVNNMRLSSVSSQDSGFTSQDTLFLRPHSPSRFKPAGPPDNHDMNGSWNMSDRPHTISSAYEKGHQRPQLQPYTFSPPESTIEEEPPKQGTLRRSTQDLPKPPVPQRCISLDRPSVPGKKPPNINKAQLQQQQKATGLPNFNLNRSDMVVPQPIYMNMNDLAALAAQKAAMGCNDGAESPELKTPTAEELTVPEQRTGDGGSSTSESSLGSSSGYGSQSTVRLEEQTHTTANDGYDMPLPAPLLDDSKYRSLPRQPCPPPPPPPQHNRPYLMHRPYSFTPGMIPEMAEVTQELGTMMLSPSRTTLRRAQSQNSAKPPPPLRRDNPDPDPGSNSTTPRGSMENLPPPPPHLLHSDDEEDGGVVMRAKTSPPEKVISQRGVSVADSVRALQQMNHHPASPRSLRRAHSVTGPSGHTMQNNQQRSLSTTYQPQQLKQQQQQRPTQEQIYAPVALLQQKIQQKQLMQNMSPEGEQYGFGMQFQQHQSQFYQQMHDAGVPLTSPDDGHPPRQYGTAAHDQIMHEIDSKLRQRPQPPPMPQQPLVAPQQSPQHVSTFTSAYDQQTASRVKRWIESRSVGNVQDCRPLLNMEIQQGFALRKTQNMNDRSAPRF